MLSCHSHHLIADKGSDVLQKVRFGSGWAQCSRTFFSRFSHEPDLGPMADTRCIGKCGRCNLPPAGGKLHRHFHSSVPIQTLPIQTVPIQTLPIQTLPIQTLPGWGGVDGGDGQSLSEG